MGGLTLLDRARAAGLSVTADGDRLVIKGPRRAEEVARELIEQKAEVLALLAVPVEPLIEPPVEDPAKRPPPPPGLVAPRRTPWGTVAYSAPDAPPIEVFGPPPPWRAPATERSRPSAADPFAAAEREAIQDEPPDEDLASLRAVLADWPLPWRARWGRRANALAEQGIPFPEDERRAFVEVQAEKAGGAEPPPIKTPSSIAPSASVRWQCTNRFCRDGSRWWMSGWGVVNCSHCVPPAFLGLAVAQGTGADAPLVDPGRSHQIPSIAYELRQKTKRWN